MPVSSEAGRAKLEVRLAIERGGFDVAVVARLVPVGREQQQHVRRTPGRQVSLTGGTEPTGGMRQTTTTESAYNVQQYHGKSASSAWQAPLLCAGRAAGAVTHP